MKGDFSRDTFDLKNRFRRVLMQQGRVLLDADVNENHSILLHYLESLAADLLGPAAGTGFEITVSDDTVTIGQGHYYVDGILCENDEPISLDKQPYPYWVPDAAPSVSDPDNLIYLDVWERHIAAVEQPSIVEIALGGPDTCSRSQVIWQAKAHEWTGQSATDEQLNTFFDSFEPARTPELEARALEDDTDTDPCNVSPESRFRGAENQLYRVEIHNGGTVGGGSPPTFKWSRDNGSVVFPIESTAQNTVTLTNLGRDDRSTLQPGDWVELVDDLLSWRDWTATPPPPRLLSVAFVDTASRLVRFDQTDVPSVDAINGNAYLRRWDHGRRKPKANTGTIADDGAVLVEEGTWLTLEDGVQVLFHGITPDNDVQREYRTGDYWLVPARVVTGDVIWPKGVTKRPQGVEHHYAALALVHPAEPQATVHPLRHVIKPNFA